jgi:hypothetical protein
MRYTKYNYKKKKKNKAGVFIYFTIIIILGLVLGGLVFNILTSDNIGISKLIDDFDQTEVNQNSADDKILQLVTIQCGVYQKKENAEGVLAKIPDSFPKFIAEADGKYKVIAGIFLSEKAEEKLSELKNASIESVVIKYQINQNSNEGKIEGEIIKAYIQIIAKAKNSEVKSINTDEFKKWIDDIVNENINNGDKINSLVERVKQLPAEYDKEKVQEDNLYIYNILKTYQEPNY